VEELGGVERIDIVRWNDSLQVLIQNALQPATIEEVFLYEKLQRAIVLVKEDQLSLAIGRRGQNVRLASKLVDWDIEIMTHDELNTAIEKAESQFSILPGMFPELVEVLIEEGFLSYEDVAILTPAELMEMGGMDEDTAADMIATADEEASRLEKESRFGKPRESAQTATPATAGAAPPAETQSEASKARQAFDNLFAPTPPAAEEAAVSAEPIEAVVEPAGTEEVAGAEIPAIVEMPTEVADSGTFAVETPVIEDLVQGPAPVEAPAASPAEPTPAPPTEGTPPPA
jgi:N utilization substance protein A